jgi:NDP-sugar pyrophosphorylase family protein
MEEYNIEKAYVGDFIGIRGTVKIENGEHIVVGMNHWVAQGLETIGSFLINTTQNGSTASIGGAVSSWNIYIGSDTSTPTTVGMTLLVSPIGNAPGTAPNTKSYSGAYYSSSTIPVVITWMATWNAGTVSGTLGEVGLYLYINTNGLTNGTTASNPGLASRLSAADGSFTAFTINTAAALTVTWTVSLVYA